MRFAAEAPRLIVHLLVGNGLHVDPLSQAPTPSWRCTDLSQASVPWQQQVHACPASWQARSLCRVYEVQLPGQLRKYLAGDHAEALGLTKMGAADAQGWTTHATRKPQRFQG